MRDPMRDAVNQDGVDDERTGARAMDERSVISSDRGAIRRVRAWFTELSGSLAGLLPVIVAMAVGASVADAQEHIPSKVSIQFNRYHDYGELVGHLREIEAAYPELVSIQTIGKSLEGREMIVCTINSKKTGSDRDKPAMWIDANVHGNEVQGGEVVLYSVWYLTKAYGVNAEITRILDEKSFYFLPSQNPDGRDAWFHEAQNSSSSRSNRRPVDNDRDGLVDEDGYDDLDGDGSITTMWKEDPEGAYIRDEKSFSGFRRAEEEKGETGSWTRVGSEGLDNDGDGRINEDPPGGDDMNRDWPSDWQPSYIQFGAGPYPFSSPETRCIGAFILEHPNIAAAQSYHNSGGMILRGPGADYLDGIYPREDQQVYDAMGKVGARLLPYYRYMVLYKDLYTVHGGFVNWVAEGLGIFSFTNELWSSGKMFQGDGSSSDEDQELERDRLRFGATFKEYTEFDHPDHGKVLVGGSNRWASRTTPTWMLEEECHRNFAFTTYHADQMAVLALDKSAVKKLARDLYQVTVRIENQRLIPTRSAISTARKIGRPDLLMAWPAVGAEVVAAGPCRAIDSDTFSPVLQEPTRLVLNRGVPSEGQIHYRFLIRGPANSEISFQYEAEKALDLKFTLRLEESKASGR